MPAVNRRDLMHDLVLPTVLFAVLGGMTWAVRGCSGYGAANGCLFAGVTWGAAWWFIAREPGGAQSRRYASGWIILALTVGIGMSGARGWMQWPSFWRGELMTDAPAGKFVPISRTYGFIWLFVAGMPWAGIGACMLAWCGSKNPMRLGQWVLRIACGIGGAYLALAIFDALPEVFLPLYSSIKAQYQDLAANPNLKRLIGDNRSAIMHLGIYLGFLGFEVGRRDWKNVTLILTVGLVNGAGWALLQNWNWAHTFWPAGQFNFWRCWESSGGISIGIAYGLAFYLTNAKIPPQESAARLTRAHPNLERFGAYLGLLLGLVISIRNGLKGWFNLYRGNEDYWSHVLWMIFGPLLLVGFAAIAVWSLLRRLPKGFQGDVIPEANKLIWFVLITQNILAQLVTGPLTQWQEVAFNIYYVLLFLTSAVIVYHYHLVQGDASRSSPLVPGRGQ